MEIIVPTLIVFCFVMVIMSVGIFARRKPLQGSCGGIAAMMGGCDVCELREQCIEKKTPQCDEHKNG